MRRAIEKLTFLLLSFAAASLLSFALLARLCDRGSPHPATLPLLVNLSPHDARELTLNAVRTLGQGGPNAARASAELARLGGAALPHVLPALESLAPVARGRVALALSPIATRMGVAAPEDVDTPERAIVFFTRFWQDRSADFRAQAVRRKVQRLAERSLPLRRKEVVELDTFALGELFEALGHVRGPEDVKRVERLTPVLAHVTGTPLVLPPDPSVAAAATLVTAWRDWAFEHGADFTTLDGPGRLAATVMQTRYFHFLASVPRALDGDDPHGAFLFTKVLTLGLGTLPEVLVALALAVALSLGVRRVLAAERAWQRFTLPVAGAVATLPLTALVVRGGAAGPWGATGLLALGLTALLLLELEGPRSEQYPVRRVATRATTLVPLALTAALAAEAARGRGLGKAIHDAIGRGHLEVLLWIAAFLSASGSLAMLVHGFVELRQPALVPTATELIPARRGRAPVLAMGAVLGFFASIGALQAFMPGPFGLLARGVWSTLGATLITTAVAALVGGLLGLLAGGISRATDTLLARLSELALALPAPLVACAAFGLVGPAAPAALGVLRGIELAQLLRARLAEQRVAEEMEPPSLGRAPLSPYLRRVLPAALGPVVTQLALTGAWIAALEAAVVELGVPRRSLGVLAVDPSASGWAALAAVAGLVGALVWLGRDATPHEVVADVTDTGVVLALKRRIDSVRPSAPDASGEPPFEP